jgi:hypothetical protein
MLFSGGIVSPQSFYTGNKRTTAGVFCRTDKNATTKKW